MKLEHLALVDLLSEQGNVTMFFFFSNFYFHAGLAIAPRSIVCFSCISFLCTFANDNHFFILITIPYEKSIPADYQDDPAIGDARDNH